MEAREGGLVQVAEKAEIIGAYVGVVDYRG